MYAISRRTARVVVRAGYRTASGVQQGGGADSGGQAGAGQAGSPLRRLLAGAAAYGEGGGAGELHWSTTPYAARPPAPAPPDPPPPPPDATVLLFPGQGSEYVGMGQRLLHLPAVRDLYDLASETLK